MSATDDFLQSSDPLDRTSDLPLWSQLEAVLRSALLEGRFDERFPTDLELTTAFDVSRHTAREAIGHLAREGLIRRVRGRGTVVVKPEFEQTMGAVYSLFQSVESQGREQASEVVALEVVTDVVAAGQLGVAPDTELVYLERVRRADEEPLALDRVWLLAEVARPLLDADFSHTALYRELQRIGQPVPTEGWERIRPFVPDLDDADALHMEEGQVAFFVERLGIAGGRPVEWRTTIIHGDRFRFVSRWSSTGPSTVDLSAAD